MNFSDFPISEEIKRAIREIGFEEPSPIQKEAMPGGLGGGDGSGQGKSGSGKTAAFGIPVIETVQPDRYVQALILTPTRELAIQVSGELQKLSAYKNIRTLPIYGGQSITQQIRALQRGVQIVVGTPGRVLDHLHRKTLHLDRVRTVVLDEADEMLDMGFIGDIEEILKYVKTKCQMLLFSATMPPAIRGLARKYMRKPQSISIDTEATAPLIEQVYYKVFEQNKLETLCRIIDSENIELGILFCRTKKRVVELTEALRARGYLADGLHGDLTQCERDKVMNKFRAAAIDLLVATDVAARGIDVENVSHVINYDIPLDPESYVHRIGRTGRAGRPGLALTFVTPQEMKHLRSIEQKIKRSIPSVDVPSLEDVIEKRRHSWKKIITDAIAQHEKQRFLPFAQEMLAQFRAEDVVSALLKLHFENDAESVYEFGETGATKGMVRFFLNVGHNANLTPKRLSEEMAELAGISWKEIGRIDMFDRFTFVEVSERIAPFVYEALNGSKMNGAKVNIEPAKPRQKR